MNKLLGFIKKYRTEIIIGVIVFLSFLLKDILKIVFNI
jgi:hypothetical protein